VTPYGQTLEYCYLDRVWRQLLEVSHYEERVAKVKEFNKLNRLKKRGIACIPTKYGMSFTARHLNQVRSVFVCIYCDCFQKRMNSNHNRTKTNSQRFSFILHSILSFFY
jgi:xanthine dehydrogenase/oxidase